MKHLLLSVHAAFSMFVIAFCQVELSGTAVWPGLDGLLLLLSALARQPLHCAWAHMLPVVCGAQAAFVACPTTHSADTLAMMVVAQLMPDAAANAAAADAAAAAAAQDAAEQQGAGATSVAGDADGAQKQQAGGQQQQQQQLRGVVQLVVRASSHEVLLAIQQEPDAWVNDISQVRCIAAVVLMVLCVLYDTLLKVSLLAVPGSTASARCGLLRGCCALLLCLQWILFVLYGTLSCASAGSAWVNDISQVRLAAVSPVLCVLCDILYSKCLCWQCGQGWNQWITRPGALVLAP
jgi:hypothetical protein